MFKFILILSAALVLSSCVTEENNYNIVRNIYEAETFSSVQSNYVPRTEKIFPPTNKAQLVILPQGEQDLFQWAKKKTHGFYIIGSSRNSYGNPASDAVLLTFAKSIGADLILKKSKRISNSKDYDENFLFLKQITKEVNVFTQTKEDFKFLTEPVDDALVGTWESQFWLVRVMLSNETEYIGFFEDFYGTGSSEFKKGDVRFRFNKDNNLGQVFYKFEGTISIGDGKFYLKDGDLFVKTSNGTEVFVKASSN